jgi:hypothetical protein
MVGRTLATLGRTPTWLSGAASGGVWATGIDVATGGRVNPTDVVLGILTGGLGGRIGGRAKSPTINRDSLAGDPSGAIAGGDESPTLNPDFVSEVARLTPGNHDAFFQKMTAEDLGAWDQQLRNLPPGEIAAQGSVLATLSPTMVTRVMYYVPSLEPRYSSTADPNLNVTWRSTANLPLWGPSGRPQIDDVRQGYLGNCKFMADLVGLVDRNPELIIRNIRTNPNGTYTVTFHRSGQPLEVTVSGRVPTQPGVRPYVVARPGEGGAKWAMIYEKAYAQLYGGYGQLEPSGSVGPIIGQLVGEGPPPRLHALTTEHSLAELKARMAKGFVVTSSSYREAARLSGGLAVGNHKYAVVEVNTDGQVPTVTLVNPWGPRGAAPHRITITQAEWRRWFEHVSFSYGGDQ